MKKQLLLVVGAAAAASVIAHALVQRNNSATTEAYYAYRLGETEPSYGLPRVKTLIDGLRRGTSYDMSLPEKRFKSLGVDEKFTYCMLHGEVFSQNCAGMPYIMGAEHKLFAYLPPAFKGNEYWSPRQRQFLTQNRRRVIDLLKATVEAYKRVGLNLKQAILLIQANELIPDMLATFGRDRKDLDLLTVCMLLMHDARYKPFLTSAECRHLYGSPNSNYKEFIEASKANELKVIKFAKAFELSRNPK